jgi:hypothetical protein
LKPYKMSSIQQRKQPVNQPQDSLPNETDPGSSKDHTKGAI